MTDAAWERIAPLLPVLDGRGRPWRDHRQVIDEVLWRLRTSAPWRDLPDRYGPWQTVYERFARWEAGGTWARLLEHAQVRDDAVGRLEWMVSVDSSVNRAHQHAAGARKKGDPDGDKLEDPQRSAARQALGRSHGGLTTKVHLAVDGRGLPLSFVVTAGNVNDSTVFDAVLDAIKVPRATAGRPRRHPGRSAATRHPGHHPRTLRPAAGDGWHDAALSDLVAVDVAVVPAVGRVNPDCVVGVRSGL